MGSMKLCRQKETDYLNQQPHALWTPKPHGGYTGRRPHPPSALSYDKPPEYLEDIRDEIRREAQERLRRISSPHWVEFEINNIDNAGEAPLFTKHLLSIRKSEQMSGGEDGLGLGVHNNNNNNQEQTIYHWKKAKMYSGPNNKLHQYLSTTETTPTVTDDRYGKPTRATLLRERYWIKSITPPPELERCYHKQLHRNRQLNVNTPRRPKETPHFCKVDGKSLHGHLVGAYYNKPKATNTNQLIMFDFYKPHKGLDNFYTRLLDVSNMYRLYSTSPHYPDSTLAQINKMGRPRSERGETGSACSHSHGPCTVSPKRSSSTEPIPGDNNDSTFLTQQKNNSDHVQPNIGIKGSKKEVHLASPSPPPPLSQRVIRSPPRIPGTGGHVVTPEPMPPINNNQFHSTKMRKAATMSVPCNTPTTAPPNDGWKSPRKPPPLLSERLDEDGIDDDIEDLPDMAPIIGVEIKFSRKLED